jgi:hypothetical protein
MKGDLYLLISLSPYFLISLFPYLPISLSPYLLIFIQRISATTTKFTTLAPHTLTTNDPRAII